MQPCNEEVGRAAWPITQVSLAMLIGMRAGNSMNLPHRVTDVRSEDDRDEVLASGLRHVRNSMQHHAHGSGGKNSIARIRLDMAIGIRAAPFVKLA